MSAAEERRRASEPGGDVVGEAIGLVLPIGCLGAESMYNQIVKRTCSLYYYEPKSVYMAIALSDESGHDELPEFPPLLGDIEAVFGSYTALVVASLENAKFVAGLLEVMYQPTSCTWILTTCLSFGCDMLKRTGLLNRWMSRSLSLIGKQDLAAMGAHELLYVTARTSGEWVGVCLALSIGCYRAIAFGDPRCIVWLDCSNMACAVISANVALLVTEEIMLYACHRLGWVNFPLASGWAVNHPLGNTAFRPFEWKGYVVVFGAACMFVYSVFIAYLGPAFVFGLCQEFDSDPPVWTAADLTSCWVSNATAGVYANITSNASL